MIEIIDTLQLNRIWLLLYGVFSGVLALFLYEIVDVLASKEKRRRFKRNFLMAFNIFKNPRHKKNDKDTK